MNHTPYILHFEDDNPSFRPDEHQFVRAGSLDEASRLLFLLGDACQLYLSDNYRNNHPGLFEQLMAMSNQEHNADALFDIHAAASFLQKLPLDLKSLINSHIAVRSEDPMPPAVEKSMVHKTSESNLLISKPFTSGNLHYFNMFLETTELVFDHPSDHIQGMLILEAMRQAGIATAHLQGLPMDGVLALLVYNTNFNSFLEQGSPIVLRSYSTFHPDGKSANLDYYVCIQAMQWGKVCAETVIKALACMSTARKEEINEKLERIATRNKMNFAAKLTRLIKTESGD